jgi:putative transposase
MFLTETQYVNIDPQTASTIWFSSRCSARTWNNLVEHRAEALRVNEPCGYGVQKKLLPKWKKEDERLKMPSSQQLQEVVKEYHGAIKSFFEKRKNGDKDCKPPSFRKSSQFYPQHFPQRYNSFVIEGATLKVAFGKERKTWLTLPLRDGNYTDVKTVRLCYDDLKKQLYVCLCREVQKAEPKKDGLKLYFDPGCKTTLTGIGSDGKIYEYDINPLRQMNMGTCKLIDRLMSERDKKVKRSLRWRRLNKRIAKLWRKLKYRTKAYLHTLANRIFSSHPNLSEIHIGDWKKQETLADTPSKFINKRINRAVQNNNPLRMLVDFLSYKGQLKHGVCVKEFDERGTTRTCSQCGHKHTDGVSPVVRLFHCESCGFKYPRDWQSGLNFIRKFEPAVWNGLSGNYPSSSVRKALAPFSLKTQRAVRTMQFALAS